MILYIVCGTPGSGKTTWIKKHLTKNDIHISRDDIRLSILKDNEDFFSKEEKVFELFIKKIRKFLLEGKNVYADATHLSPQSRLKVYDKIKDIKDISVIAIGFNSSYKICYKRNEKRNDSRTYVPQAQLKNMYNSYIEPSVKENIFDKIYKINVDKYNKISLVKENFYGE